MLNAADGKPFASGITNIPGGPLASLTFGNGRTLSQTFDRRHEPLSVTSGPLSLAYTPTPAGDGALVTNGSEDPSGCAHGVSRNFSYDLLHRLVAWSDSVSDGTNRCPAETISDLAAGFTYLDGTDLVSDQWTPDTAGLPAYAFGYDYQGNVSAIGQYDSTGTSIALALCLRHDALGRLTMAGHTSNALSNGAATCLTDLDVSSPIAQYRYDSRNRRVARSDNGAWTYFVSDASGNLLSEIELTGDPMMPWARVRDYVWLDGRPIAQIEYDASVPHVYYVHADHLGTPRALTNESGQLVWNSFQRPYGEVGERVVQDPASGRTVVTNLRLPGQYDERLFQAAGINMQGPYYNWNRWYLPGLGRYLEPDPIALAGGFNTPYGVDWYGYAEQNPLSNTDPMGLTDRTKQCQSLADSIREIQQRIDKRLGELDEDPQGLPETCAGDKQNPSLSRNGHRMLRNMDKALLASKKALYALYCSGMGPPPFSNPFPAQDPLPEQYRRVYRPNNNQVPLPSPAGTALVTVGGIIIIIILLLPVGV